MTRTLEQPVQSRLPGVWRNIGDRASAVSKLLGALQGEVDASKNPHRVALHQLGVDVNGWAEACYNDAAFRSWQNLLERAPDDIETVHHLAIMHHSRAMDLEKTHPKDSDADWRAAISYWHRLWQSDGFWQGIGAAACRDMLPEKSAPIINELRRSLPRWLVQIHYDVAFEPNTKFHRSKYHVQAAHGSPFGPEVVEEVRRATYDRAVSVVPANVWYSDELNPATIAIGTDVIEAFLKIDPTCTYALIDALRLQVRLLRSMHSDIQALGKSNPAKRRELLIGLKEAADHWAPYMDVLVEQRNQIPQEDREEACQKLGRWYRRMGDVRCGLDLEPEAIKYFEQGVKSTDSDDDQHQICRERLGHTYAYVAREKAHNKERGAKAYAESVRRRDDLSIGAHFLLANAFSLLRDFNAAEEVCQAGIDLPPTDSMDWDEIEEDEKDRKRLHELSRNITVQRLLSEASEHLQAERHARALDLLNQAASISLNDNVLFLRCQCYLALGDIDAATADVAAFRKSAGADADSLKAASKLQKMIDEAAPNIRKFGPTGAKERQKAISAHNAGNFAQAEQILRSLLSRVPQAGRKDVQHDLSIVLSQRAIGSVNAALEKGGGLHSDTIQVFIEARAMLKEAVQMDPSNGNAAENLAALASILPS